MRHDLALCCLLILGFVWPQDGVTQEPHDSIRNSLAHITATGVRDGNEKSDQATGFLVSSDGLILTSDTMLDALEDEGVKDITFTVAIREKSEDRRKAYVIDRSDDMNLLLLKLPPGADPYPSVKLGSSYEHPVDADILFSSFPDSSEHRVDQGKIESRDGPVGYLWSTDFKYSPGESGSPVYDGNGRVIAVAYQNENSDGGFIIPIDFAEAFVVQVRLRELRGELRKVEENLEHLRRQFIWNLDLDQGRLRYDKMVAGEPQVASVQVKMILDVISYAADSPLINLKQSMPLNVEGWSHEGVRPSELWGEFDLKPLFDSLQTQITSDKIADVGFLSVEIVPLLDNDETLEVVRLPISAVPPNRFTFP